MFGRIGPNWPSRAIRGRHDGVPDPNVYCRTTSWDALYLIAQVRLVLGAEVEGGNETVSGLRAAMQLARVDCDRAANAKTPDRNLTW